MRLVASDRVLCRVVSGEAVLLDLDTETYFGLNAVGARFWDLLTTSGSVDVALEALTREFDAAPETLRRDVEELADTLIARGLLRIADA
jgi:hypothetical protein